MRILMEYSANPEARDKVCASDSICLPFYILNVSQDFSTPLHFAASQGYVAAMKLLIKNGASVNAPNKV